jgi:copper homeostasis protein
MRKILLEICCASVDDVVAAEKGGADRVELCSALFLGGLTPSIGTLLEAKKRIKIPVMSMVRPRAGGFCYSDAEMAVMEQDTEIALRNGADGVVFGILKPDGTVDVERSRRLRDLVGDRQAVFHRAFDVTPDPFRALDELIDLGITRVLTSGQQNSAPEGAPLIAKLIEHARDRIQVLPGGGIQLHTLDDLLTKTHCSQIHLTAFSGRCDVSTQLRPFIAFGGALYPSEVRYDVTDSTLVERVATAIGKSKTSTVGR